MWWQVLWVLAKPGDVKVIKLLAHLLQSPLALLAHGMLALRHEDPRVRQNAAMGLGKMGVGPYCHQHPPAV